MPDIFRKSQPHKEQQSVEVANRKSYATQDTYEGYLKKWILPRWRSYRLGDVKAVQVEQWLRSVPLAQGSRAKIRNIMSALYSHAIRWEWTNRNPITAVRQSGKRSKTPTILTVEQIQALLEHLDEPYRTMVLLDASTGLRVGELLGLKWKDVNFKSWRSASPAQWSSKTSDLARPKLPRKRYRSMPHWPIGSRNGDSILGTTARRIGPSRVRTSVALSLTGLARSSEYI